MRDPMNWALPLYRLFGILVKVHLFFFLITLPVFGRLVQKVEGVHWFDLFMISIGLVFIIVLLHEYGHCFAARAVGGSSEQILLWPLGGLAFVEVPHTPRAHFWTTLWGPLVNLIICVCCAIAMLAGGFSPVASLNPFGNPITTPAYNLSNGRTYTSEYEYRYYRPGSLESISSSRATQRSDGALVGRDAPNEVLERALAPTWMVWAWRICWLSWWLFLFNVLLPAYPMDGGRLLHSLLWARTDYRSATVTCCYTGYGVGILMLMVSFFTNEAILVGLGIFILINCYRTLSAEFDGENSLGYDFSQGYTSLEKDDPPAPATRRPGMLKRWLQARQIRKLKVENEQQAQDEVRMDDLLDKIARHGQHSLTDEEKRFMKRFSDRLRNRPS